MYAPILAKTGWTVVKLLGNNNGKPAGIRPKSKPVAPTTLSRQEAQMIADKMNKGETNA